MESKAFCCVGLKQPEIYEPRFFFLAFNQEYGEDSKLFIL